MDVSGKIIQGHLHVDEGHAGHMTTQDCERPTISGPDDFATGVAIANLIEGSQDRAVRSFETQVKAWAVECWNFLADGHGLAVGRWDSPEHAASESQLRTRGAS
jgi:hypothetical protein